MQHPLIRSLKTGGKDWKQANKEKWREKEGSIALRRVDVQHVRHIQIRVVNSREWESWESDDYLWLSELQEEQTSQNSQSPEAREQWVEEPEPYRLTHSNVYFWAITWR